MQGLARVMNDRGVSVTGCDAEPARARAIEDRYDIPTEAHHDLSHVRPADADDGPGVIVRSAAVPADHPELTGARERGVPDVVYSKCLGALFNKQSGIAVAGTHGKTTCSAMLSVVLEKADMDPTCLIGGVLQQWSSSARPGEGRHFVAEACEFGENFRFMTPDHVLLTNVDQSHLDYYDNDRAVRDAFGRFLESQRALGFVVCEQDAPVVDEVVQRAAGKLQRISRSGEDDWFLRPDRGAKAFTVQSRGDRSPDLPVPLRGDHQVMNAAQVAVMARLLGADWSDIRDGLDAFEGVHRRFEIHRDGSNGAAVIDDYGHHPEELTRTIDAAKEAYPDRELVVCFQPHQFSRTYHFREDWGEALSEADTVWLVPIYEARDSERDRKRISIEDVADRVRSRTADTRLLDGPGEAGRRMSRNDTSDRAYLVIGAGDIGKAVDAFERHTP